VVVWNNEIYKVEFVLNCMISVGGMDITLMTFQTVPDSECPMRQAVRKALAATLDGKVEWKKTDANRYEAEVPMGSDSKHVVVVREEIASLGSPNGKYNFRAGDMLPVLRNTQYAPVADLGQLVCDD